MLDMWLTWEITDYAFKFLIEKYQKESSHLHDLGIDGTIIF
jgi:hypothetical protein